MPNGSRRQRNYQVEYARRNAAAKRAGFTSYGAQRRDLAKAWRHYEPGKSAVENRRQYNEFKHLRERMAKIRKSSSIPADEKQAASNFIMHDYMLQYHAEMMEPSRERIVWSFEGETP